MCSKIGEFERYRAISRELLKSKIMKIGLTYNQQVRDAGVVYKSITLHVAYKSITMMMGLYDLHLKSASWT